MKSRKFIVLTALALALASGIECEKALAQVYVQYDRNIFENDEISKKILELVESNPNISFHDLDEDLKNSILESQNGNKNGALSYFRTIRRAAIKEVKIREKEQNQSNQATDSSDSNKPLNLEPQTVKFIEESGWPESIKKTISSGKSWDELTKDEKKIYINWALKNDDDLKRLLKKKEKPTKDDIIKASKQTYNNDIRTVMSENHKWREFNGYKDEIENGTNTDTNVDTDTATEVSVDTGTDTSTGTSVAKSPTINTDTTTSTNTNTSTNTGTATTTSTNTNTSTSTGTATTTTTSTNTNTSTSTGTATTTSTNTNTSTSTGTATTTSTNTNTSTSTGTATTTSTNTDTSTSTGTATTTSTNTDTSTGTGTTATNTGTSASTGTSSSASTGNSLWNALLNKDVNGVEVGSNKTGETAKTASKPAEEAKDKKETKETKETKTENASGTKSLEEEKAKMPYHIAVSGEELDKIFEQHYGPVKDNPDAYKEFRKYNPEFVPPGAKVYLPSAGKTSGKTDDKKDNEKTSNTSKDGKDGDKKTSDNTNKDGDKKTSDTTKNNGKDGADAKTTDDKKNTDKK